MPRNADLKTALADYATKFADSAFCMGEYDHKASVGQRTVGMACNGPELVRLAPLIEGLTRAFPNAKPVKSQLEPVLRELAAKFKFYDKDGIDAWVDRKTAEIVTVMNHFRRLRSQIRWTQAISRLDTKDVAVLRPATQR